MAGIFITSTAVRTQWEPYALSNYERMMRATQCSTSSRHLIAPNAAEADCIVFVGSRCKFHWDVLQSRLYKQHPTKCILFDFQDNTIPRVPGLYMQIPPHLQGIPIYETGFYPRVFDNFVLKAGVPFSACTYLFSFVGRVANSMPVRGRVVQLKHPRAYVEGADSGQSDKDTRYADILSKSKFVLCPRGLGPSTWRLFETMRIGRVPVIIADEWVEPKGMQWNSFSVRIKEEDIDSIPARLERLEHRAEAMGNAARDAWNKHFSEAGSFEWVADACARIQSNMGQCNRVALRSIASESLQPLYRKVFYREFVAETLKRTLAYFFQRKFGEQDVINRFSE
ncbi:MAG TPA: exostosin family protein [Hyphomicrobiaceae bacterium]|nr:exostosin family protein [Hyphomicrobiaceae bacterium]